MVDRQKNEKKKSKDETLPSIQNDQLGENTTEKFESEEYINTDKSKKD